MIIGPLGPAWVGWFAGALVWAGIGALWFFGNAPDDMRPILIGIAALASASYVARGAYAYSKRNEPAKERAPRQDPDSAQLLIFALVAVVVVFSVVAGFQLLDVVSHIHASGLVAD